MIGEVSFSSEWVTRTATLSDDGEWTVSPRLSPERADAFLELADRLDERSYGPSDGIYGRRKVYEMARLLGGSYQFPQSGRDQDGKVY